ncbi:MAG: type II toxin-antitoxin system HipA family toxin [Gemmatimonadota bacterium]
MPDTPPILAEAEVRLWGDTVGALVELASGRIVFEYAEAFRRRGLEISPLHLPTTLAGPVSFEELRRKDSFRGLPGVLADALPDAFGRRVIRAWYAARGMPDRGLSPVQQLLYVGERAIGALAFHPAEEPGPAGEEALELQALALGASQVVRGRTEVAVPEIYRIGSSAGGRRPKAIVHFDPQAGTLRSGGVPAAPGEVSCLLKFDGIGDDHDADELGAPKPWNRIEAAYGDMARAAGIDMPRLEILEADGYAHLLVPRFDVGAGEGGGPPASVDPGQPAGERSSARAHPARLHQHTLGGLLHVDYNDVGASSYEEYFRTIQVLGMAYDALAEGFRRMAFNVLAVNQDDHVKNLSFHMDGGGAWRLAPAYDVTFARGEGFTRTHQMRVRGKLEGIGMEDLLAVAAEFGIKRAAEIVSRVREVLAGWEACAERRGVPEAAAEAIRRELDARAREAAG